MAGATNLQKVKIKRVNLEVFMPSTRATRERVLCGPLEDSWNTVEAVIIDSAECSTYMPEDCRGHDNTYIYLFKNIFKIGHNQQFFF